MVTHSKLSRTRTFYSQLFHSISRPYQLNYSKDSEVLTDDLLTPFEATCLRKAPLRILMGLANERFYSMRQVPYCTPHIELGVLFCMFYIALFLHVLSTVVSSRTAMMSVSLIGKFYSFMPACFHFSCAPSFLSFSFIKYGNSRLFESRIACFSHHGATWPILKTRTF